jgi:hypothetical protein
MLSRNPRIFEIDKTETDGARNKWYSDIIRTCLLL